MLLKVAATIVSIHFQKVGLMMLHQCIPICIIFFLPMGKLIANVVILLMVKLVMLLGHLQTELKKGITIITSQMHITELFLNLLMSLKEILHVYIFIWQHAMKIKFQVGKPLMQEAMLP